MQIVQSNRLRNVAFSLSTFLLAANLEHAIVIQNWLLRLTKSQQTNCKGERKRGCQHVVGMEMTRANRTKTQREGNAAQGPDTAPLDASQGPLTYI